MVDGVAHDAQARLRRASSTGRPRKVSPADACASSPLLVLPIIIVGGIFTGIFTVTESAAVGVAYTLVIGVLLASPACA